MGFVQRSSLARVAQVLGNEGDTLLADASHFELIAYRGAIVFTRNGWIRDVKSRGGTVTQVPSGFFHGIEAGRFGSAVPYVYELPPVWLLIDDGIEAGTYELLQVLNYSGVAESAENQRRDVAAIGAAAGAAVSALPTAVKVGLAGIGVVVVLELLSFLPKRR